MSTAETTVPPNPHDPHEQPLAFVVHSMSGHAWLNPSALQRPAFTAGPAVRLNDGQFWHLPIFDTALLQTTPGLIAAVNRSYDLAALTGDELDNIEVLTSYNTTLMTIALMLLTQNYQIGTEDFHAKEYDPTTCTAMFAWLTLLTFVDLTHLVDLQTAVATAIVAADPLWYSHLGRPGNAN